MKLKMLIMSLFLVGGLVLSGLLSITSLSITKQIKSTFRDDQNILLEGFAKPLTDEMTVQKVKKSYELLEGFAKPPTGEMTFLEEKKGVEEVKPVLIFFKEKLLPTEDTTPSNTLKTAAYYSPFVMLSFLIIYFLRKHYKKNNRRGNNNRNEIEEKQIKTAVLKVGIVITPFAKENTVATSIPIHEIRRFLQKWEAGLFGKKIKREAETINEWFERVNGPVEIIPIYEKVRYGEQNCTEDEVRFIKNTLKL